MNKRILFTIAGFVILGFLIQPAYASSILRAGSIELTKFSLPSPELELVFSNGYLILSNHSTETQTVPINNKGISLDSGEKIKWPSPGLLTVLTAIEEGYFIEQEGEKRVYIGNLLEAANISEIKFRNTPFQIEGTINDQPFQITGVAIDPNKPTPAEFEKEK